MPRGPRVVPESGVFHIMLRGNNKKCVFRRDCELRYFKKLIMRYKRKFKFLLYHYALMKNHVHLCIQITETTHLSKMMQGLQLAYYHYQRKRRSFVGHLWQGRFKSVVIKDDRQLLAVGLYIERNPVEAGIVEDPKEYVWSSYRYYAIGEKDLLVDISPLYIDLGISPEARQVEYQKLMQIQTKELKEVKRLERKTKKTDERNGYNNNRQENQKVYR